MNPRHKTERDKLRNMPVDEAGEYLRSKLPPNERDAIFYVDVMQESLRDVGWNHLNCEETTVKKYRQRGYTKLTKK